MTRDAGYGWVEVWIWGAALVFAFVALTHWALVTVPMRQRERQEQRAQALRSCGCVLAPELAK